MGRWKLTMEYRELEACVDHGSFDRITTASETGVYPWGKPIRNLFLEESSQAPEGKVRLSKYIYTFSKDARGKNGGSDEGDGFSVNYSHGLFDICGNKPSCGLHMVKGDGHVTYLVDETVGFERREYDEGLFMSWLKNKPPSRTRTMTAAEVEEVCSAFMWELSDFDRTRYSWRHIADDVGRLFGARDRERRYLSEKQERSAMKGKIVESIARIRSKSLDAAV